MAKRTLEIEFALGQDLNHPYLPNPSRPAAPPPPSPSSASKDDGARNLKSTGRSRLQRSVGTILWLDAIYLVVIVVLLRLLAIFVATGPVTVAVFVEWIAEFFVVVVLAMLVTQAPITLVYIIKSRRR